MGQKVLEDYTSVLRAYVCIKSFVIVLINFIYGWSNIDAKIKPIFEIELLFLFSLLVRTV